ncbi:Substrate binding domain of ABC-type glycine betaine transport system [Modestobacter sp. DSM 44400]|uniref:glycine betaine ABC transporter substrate-binding protein n=1 Tax=Modestobacter sp. DSM 44400 TaxID=1550230 RepID=UPI000898B0BA|nr:glycine betaine ABC transporter substrate-binding protein [Modestobacter sp. DSM 44400]SDY18650.1 Substrate binding domain of ABC-type glycine betaine transport system [Modestobacter sp. DSM 44400]
MESEFASRNDGFVPMLDAYGLKLGDPQGVPRDNVRTLDTGAVYEATDQGACNFGEVFTTDGRIESLDLTVLEDDRDFFPAYNVAPVVYTQTLEEHPEIAGIFNQITPLITDDVMRDLNARVDVEGEQPADVAYDWMRSEGLVS